MLVFLVWLLTFVAAFVSMVCMVRTTGRALVAFAASLAVLAWVVFFDGEFPS